LWLHSLKVAQLLRSAACLHTNQSWSYLNHLVYFKFNRYTIVTSYEAVPRLELLIVVLVEKMRSYGT